MKKITVLVLALLMAVLTPVGVLGGSVKASAAGEVVNVYSWEDYIDPSVLESFEAETGIHVNYSTFGTNEDMYNELKINPSGYDLACPSEYMIQKMRAENLIQPFEMPSNYSAYGSDYIKNIFDEVDLVEKDGKVYAISFMWGTMGLVYNPAKVLDYDMETWSSLWNIIYKSKATIKDSVRDSYFLGLAFAYRDELMKLDKSAENYNATIQEIFNRTDDETIAKVEKALKVLKGNLYGLEVDSGKNDVASGKIDINFAWSGDAVYAMNEADNMKVELRYSVPKEGSNIWFDGWVMPKAAKNVENAKKFMDYISTPEMGARNMEYIGYVSAIVGDKAFSIAVDENEDGKTDLDENGVEIINNYTGIYDWMKQTYGLTEVKTEENQYASDLSYLFGAGKTVYSSETNRQFSAQYPSNDIVNRCAVMKFFEEKTNTSVNEMWQRVKGKSLPVWAIILIIVGALLIVAAILVIRFKDKIFHGKGKNKPKNKKGLKVVNTENL